MKGLKRITSFAAALAMMMSSVSFSAFFTDTAAVSAADAASATAAPTFSKESGAFKDSFSLTISASGGAQIYYTTDGSTPTTASNKYTGAINVVDRSNEDNVLSAISKELLTDKDHKGSGSNAPTVKVDKATVIRAIAVSNGISSEVVTKSYFVGKTNETYAGVPIMSIVTDADNLFDDTKGIYLQKNCKNKGKEWERPVHIDYIKNNKAVLSQNCGIRIQGGYSRGEYQKSLRLYARKDYGEKNFKYDFFEGKAKDTDGNVIKSFKKITLRNGGNDARYVKYKDSLLQTCVLDRNFSKQASVPCIAFINGEYWGIYTMQEDYNDDYVESHFGVDKDDVVMIKPDATTYNYAPKVEEGNDEDVNLWTDFVNYFMSSSKDFSKKADYEEVSQMVDLDSFADYIAVETYISNEDWPWKNWEVWRSRTVDTKAGGKYNDGKWRFMLYDVEMGAFLWGNPGESSENDKLYQAYVGNSPIEVLHRKLMKNPDYAQKVFNSIIELAENNYEPSRVKAIMEQLHDLYYPNLAKYFERFPTGFSIWHSNQCEEWINIFFNGSDKNTHYPPRDEYARDMVNFNQLVVKCDSFSNDDFQDDSTALRIQLNEFKELLKNIRSKHADKLTAYEKLVEEYEKLSLTKSGQVKELLFDCALLRKTEKVYESRWEDFKDAYNELVDVQNDSSSTDEQRTTAMDKLKTTINDLEKYAPPRPTQPDPTDPDPTKPSDVTPSKGEPSTPSSMVSSTNAKPISTTGNDESVNKDKNSAQKAMRQAKLTSLKVKSKAKKKINVSWKKVKKAKGYQVQVSTNKKFKKNKIIFKKDLKKTKLIIKNKKIKSKKTYYVRVRAYAAYKDNNGKSQKVYSAWNKKLRKVRVK